MGGVWWGSQTHLQHSMNVTLQLRIVTCKIWRNLFCNKWCHNCELGQAKTIWLDPTNPSSTQRDAKHASKEGRLDLCGDRHWSDIHKCRALPTGDGWYRARSGKSSGSHFHLLRRVVWSWPHVGAVCRCTKHVLEGVSALNMDSYGLNYIVAHDYVVAPTRTYVSLARVIPCCSLCFQV